MKELENIYPKNAVRKILSFGHRQVFRNASVYTCVLVLAKAQTNELEYTEASPEDVKNSSVELDRIDVELDNGSWSFQSPEEKAVVEKIESFSESLESATKKIYQGLVTSADDIYLVNTKSEENGIAQVENGVGEIWQIESDLLYPLLKGENVSRYSPLDPPNSIILPYETGDGSPKFIPESRLESSYPRAHEYFSEHEERLRERDSGGMDHTQWYDFTRAQNMEEFLSQKLVTPDISYEGNFTIDFDGMFHKSAVYGVVGKEWIPENYLLALLNSNLLWFYLQGTGNVLRGVTSGSRQTI